MKRGSGNHWLARVRWFVGSRGLCAASAECRSRVARGLLRRLLRLRLLLLLRLRLRLLLLCLPFGLDAGGAALPSIRRELGAQLGHRLQVLPPVLPGAARVTAVAPQLKAAERTARVEPLATKRAAETQSAALRRREVRAESVGAQGEQWRVDVLVAAHAL